MNQIKWFGYRHTNGSLQLKRFFSPLDLYEADESPFVQQTYGPFVADSREEAERLLKEEAEA